MDTTLGKIKQFSDDQYSNEKRLNARIQIYKFCEKKLNWREWIFDKLDFRDVTQILELGCGNGLLWKDNIDRVPENIHVVLTDLSKGMVDSARINLKKYQRRFGFLASDASRTPFADNTFQMIIANHMLYYFENKQKIFTEIDRLLTDDGFAYASTISTSNFKELIDIVAVFDKNLEFENVQTVRSFNLANGECVLSSHFNISDIFIYQNDIIVNNTAPVILYLASCYSPEQLDILKSKYIDFKKYLESVIKETGAIRITNKNVLFKFRKKR